MARKSKPVSPAEPADERQAAPPENGRKNRRPPDVSFWQPRSLDELAAAQGVQPVGDPRELHGDFWPEDETADEFLTWLRELRRESRGKG